MPDTTGISVAFSLSVSECPPSTHPSLICPKHIPSSHFIPPLHPSHVLKFISLYLFPLVNPFPSLHLAYLLPPLLPSCSVTVSSHSINQASEARTQCSTALHSPCLLPSVPVSLAFTLKRFRLPDIVSPLFTPHPTTTTAQLQVRRWEGRRWSQDSAYAWLDITWHILRAASALQTSNSSSSKDRRAPHPPPHQPHHLTHPLDKFKKITAHEQNLMALGNVNLMQKQRGRREFSHLLQVSSCGWHLRKENCRKHTKHRGVIQTPGI